MIGNVTPPNDFIALYDRIEALREGARTSGIGGDMEKKAADVASYVRENWFSGDRNQYIKQTVRDYEICAKKLGLNVHHKTYLFVKVLKGYARNFIFENCKD